MKMRSIMIVVAIALTAASEPPKSSMAVKARRSYEQSVKIADEQYRQALKAAEDVHLKSLHEALDAALMAKNLKEANEIDAALTAAKAKAPAADPQSATIKEAQQTYRKTSEIADELRLQKLKAATEEYLSQLQVALDAALEAKDLKEANRIDAAIKELATNIQLEMPDPEIQTEGDRGQISFMGIVGVGNTVVYLVDTSSSMNGSRLKVAKGQLKASVQLLQPSQQFAVIFYNEFRERLKLRRQPEQAMYAATDLNKQLAAQEIDRITPDRGTQHKPALMEALSLKPDVIFLLSDGDGPELSAADLKQIARETDDTRIHVITFHDGSGTTRKTRWLQRLASQSKGEFRESNRAPK